MRPRTAAIRELLLSSIPLHPNDIASYAAETLAISTQAVGRHLRQLAEEGLITASGSTRGRTYKLVTSEHAEHYPLAGLEEDRVWREFVAPKLISLPGNVRDIITHVPVKLTQYGDESLISRSQAKRLVARFDLFKRVILDFGGVNSIGPAFADEVFRVFKTDHPDVDLRIVNASPNVRQTILRVGNGATNDQTSLFL
ncbi:MAG: DUF4325 domain-containing protein [Gemmatimonadetes bacterium]|nr:DUF4325 domain-containing protein [Gemmatimonadota bacterium]